VIERFELLRELGRGGMAVVHLARQRDLERLVALKELSAFNSSDPAEAERFLRESRTAGALNHPGIVTVYDYFEDDGTPFISMELVTGGSLRPLIGHLSLAQTALVLEQLLGAVDFAGRQGIVHRDLKPENVLVTEDGRVRVADFGIAKATAAVQGDQVNLTSAGMTVGTPAYMSPEQAMARDDIRPVSDLYAIGCMTFEMLTGRVPFTDTATMAVLMKHVNEPVPDVRDVDPFSPEPVAEWVARMTAKDPDDRPASAAQAWEQLEDVLLEIVGPRWRRDATVESRSPVDLSDLPPPGTVAPGRPKKTAARVPGSTSGFETYQAPAALYELHGEQADFSSPEVAPAPAPVQVVTPPPAPKVTPPPVQAPVVLPVEEEEESSRSIVPVALGAAVAALVVGVLIGWAGGGGEETVRAQGDGFAVSAPAGWKSAPARRVAGLAGAMAVAPSGVASAQAVVAGRLSARDRAVLPAGWRAAGTPRRVTLRAGDGVLYRNTRTRGGRRDVYVLPTSAGAIVVSCPGGGPAADACPGVARSADPAKGEASPLGPDEGGAQELGLVLGRLRQAARAPREDLRAATSRQGQSVAAADLGRAYRAAAASLAGIELGALAAQPARDLRSSLGALARAWTAYGRAARRGDKAGAAQARRRIAAARAAARRSRARLAAAGYPEEGA
jgi:serine/threonine protein kinase